MVWLVLSGLKDGLAGFTWFGGCSGLAPPCLDDGPASSLWSRGSSDGPEDGGWSGWSDLIWTMVWLILPVPEDDCGRFNQFWRMVWLIITGLVDDLAGSTWSGFGWFYMI
jgi:hypothetical protein